MGDSNEVEGKGLVFGVDEDLIYTDPNIRGSGTHKVSLEFSQKKAQGNHD